jgi:hypothetical protein
MFGEEVIADLLCRNAILHWWAGENRQAVDYRRVIAIMNGTLVITY